MAEIKKIIFVGPPNTGKTTIKSVFFEMANPVKLLKNSLDPTRGVNSTVYSLFDLELGVFDLAGQENENWFKKDRDVFNHTDLIICVLDINKYLKENLAFIDDLINMRARENLARMKTVSNKQFDKKFQETEKELDKEFNSLVKGGS